MTITNLKILILQGSDLAEPMLQALFDTHVHISLKELNVSGCTTLTTETLGQVLYKIECDSLIMDSCPAVDDSVLASIKGMVTNISILDCRDVTDAGILALSRNAFKLESIKWSLPGSVLLVIILEV